MIASSFYILNKFCITKITHMCYFHPNNIYKYDLFFAILIFWMCNVILWKSFFLISLSLSFSRTLFLFLMFIFQTWNCWKIKENIAHWVGEWSLHICIHACFGYCYPLVVPRRFDSACDLSLSVYIIFVVFGMN